MSANIMLFYVIVTEIKKKTRNLSSLVFFTHIKTINISDY